MSPSGTGSLGVLAGVGFTPALPFVSCRAPCVPAVPAPGSLGACCGHGAQRGHSFAVPPRVSRAPSPFPVSQRRREKTSTSRDAASAAAAASPQTPTASSPAPRVPSPSAAADSGPPLLPTVPAAHARAHRARAPVGSAGKKATSRRAWHRVRILPGFQPYSSHALPLLSPRAGPDAGRGSSGKVTCFTGNAAPSKACPAPACEEAAARAGESREPSRGPAAGAGPSHWEQPPSSLPASPTEASSCG